MEITTVKELKKFLENFDDNAKVTFTDQEREPCNPYTWEIYKIKDFLNKCVSEYNRKYVKEQMERQNITTEDVVIYADF